MSGGDVHPWERAWREGRWQGVSPPLPAVTEFAQTLVEQGAKTVLDLGCGKGRHSIYLAKMGFQVAAFDVSETALKELEEHLKTTGLSNVAITKGEMSNLPFPDRHFDAVISTHVIHHATRDEIQRTIREIYRVMKSGEVGLIITLSEADYRKGSGEFVEPGTYLFSEGDERGIIHHFFSKEELLSRFNHFEILSLTEELVHAEEGSRAYFNLKFRKPVLGGAFRNQAR